MNTAHVVILLVVLCSAAAESGSGATSGLSGEDDGNYATDNDSARFMDEEEKEEPIQSGDDELSPDVNMDEFSSSGMDNSNYDKSQHPTPLSTEATLSSWTKKLHKSRPTRMKEQNNFSTVAAIEKPAHSLNPSNDSKLNLEDSKGKNRRNDSDLKKRPRIKLKILLGHEKLSKADNRSKHKHKERRYEYGSGPSSNTSRGFHVEFAHVNTIIDGMEKLKKSKTDEELAKKIRKGTESLGVSFKTFEKLSGLWISVLHRIWRVWKAKGARQVMSSIAKKIVAKTTQTLTPHFGHLFQSSIKKDHESEATVLPTKYKTRKTFSLQNNGQVNQTQHSAKTPLNQDSKTLKTKTKEKHKAIKQEDLKNGINVNVNGIQSNSTKGETNSEVNKPSNILMQGPLMRNLKRDERQNHAEQKEKQDKGLEITGKQSSTAEKESGANNNSKQSNTTTHVGSHSKSHPKSIGVKVFLKPPPTSKDKRLTSIEKNKFMNKRTELITTPTPTSSMILRNDKEYGLQQYVQGVLPNGLTSDQVNKLQDKVHHLESEVTVLQTAVAGLVDRINQMERSFEEVSNVTQNEVIYGTTAASTTSPSHSIGSTHQATPTPSFTTNQPSFLRQYDDRIMPTQQSTSTPKSQSTSNQLISLGTLSENNLETLHRNIASMVHPNPKPASIQQLQMEELPAKQHLTPTKSSSFPGHFYMKVLPASTVAENVRKQPLIEDKLKDSMNNVHQIIIPLETLYKMQAQQGIRVPDNSYAELRNGVEDNVVPTHTNTAFKDKTRKFQSAVSQHQQYPLEMDMAQDSPSSESRVRPIVNIIVPNTRTASILKKEMCWIPCKNGGECNGRNTCQCPSPFYGNQCERFSLYDFINEKANKRTVSPIKRNSMRSPRLQQLSLNDLMGLGAKIRYDFMNEKDNKRPGRPIKSNSIQRPRLRQVSLNDLIELGAKIRSTNEQAFRPPKKRFINTKTKLPISRKQFVIET